MTINWIEEFRELFYKKVSNVDSERDIILDFITTLLEKQREEYLKEVDILIKNVDEEFDLWTSGYLVACEDFEKILHDKTS